MEITKNKPVYKDRIGRFQISIWKNERVVDDKDFLMSKVVETSKACLQYSQYNKNTDSWESQRIWCFCSDVRNLVKLLDKIGADEESSAPDSGDFSVRHEKSVPLTGWI